jgi:hypothetical protein
VKVRRGYVIARHEAISVARERHEIAHPSSPKFFSAISKMLWLIDSDAVAPGDGAFRT